MDASTHSQTFVAIDPGGSGGFAWKTSTDPSVLTRKMPDTEGDIVALLVGFKQLDGDCINAHRTTVAIEAVSGYIGGVGQPGSRMFTFGYNAGLVRGAAEALGFHVIMVPPQVWQKPLGLGSSRAAGSKAAWKRKLRDCAQKLFPQVPKITLATADALLILRWALSQNEPRI